MKVGSMQSVATGGARKQLRLLVALLLATALSAAGFVSPSQASDVPVSTELIDSLVVKYEPGAAVRDSSGDPNGSDSVSADVNLTVGDNLGLGYHTINFDQAIPIAEAKTIATELAGSEAIELAEPNYPLTALDDWNQKLNSYKYLWGLDRIDQSDLPSNDTYQYSFIATGVQAYVVDGGIRSTHAEFISNGSTRVRSGYSVIMDGLGTEDCTGHGTHVAGIIGGKTFGVAKDVNLVPVRITDCQGQSDTVSLIKGIDWIVQDHVPGTPAIANFSLGTDRALGQLASVNEALANLLNDGVLPIIASGNNRADACSYSPANFADALTVNASTTSDARAEFSNFGSCTDLYAPGEEIASAGVESDTCGEVRSGTSMAAPFVTGVAANLLQQNPTLNPTELTAQIINSASENKINSGKSADTSKLLFQSRLSAVAPITLDTKLIYDDCNVLRKNRLAALAAVAEAARIAAEQKAAAQAAELASRTVKVNKKGFAGKTLAAQTGIAFTKKATVTFTISKVSKKICTKSGSKLKTLKTGQCLVTFTVQEPKPKKGKRPKAVKTSKVFIVQ